MLLTQFSSEPIYVLQGHLLKSPNWIKFQKKEGGGINPCWGTRQGATMYMYHSLLQGYFIEEGDLIAHDMFALLEAIQLSLALASARVREWVWENLISGNNPTKHIHVQINIEVEVWGNLISGNRHYICMKIKYFGQSLIIDLSEINSPAKQTYLAYKYISL